MEEIKRPVSARDISIWLDGYDDIFSDFDSRPYTDRVLSDDFINELTKVSSESEFAIDELKLLLPTDHRNKETEGVVTKRLHSYFRRNFQQMAVLKRRTIINNLLLLFLGVSMMTLATYVSARRSENVLWNILFIILEPGGWFIVWTSLDRIFNFLGKNRSKSDFFSQMHKCKIIFVSNK